MVFVENPRGPEQQRQQNPFEKKVQVDRIKATGERYNETIDNPTEYLDDHVDDLLGKYKRSEILNLDPDFQTRFEVINGIGNEQEQIAEIQQLYLEVGLERSDEEVKKHIRKEGLQHFANPSSFQSFLVQQFSIDQWNLRSNLRAITDANLSSLEETLQKFQAQFPTFGNSEIFQTEFAPIVQNLNSQKDSILKEVDFFDIDNLRNSLSTNNSQFKAKFNTAKSNLAQQQNKPVDQLDAYERKREWEKIFDTDVREKKSTLRSQLDNFARETTTLERKINEFTNTIQEYFDPETGKLKADATQKLENLPQFKGNEQTHAAIEKFITDDTKSPAEKAFLLSEIDKFSDALEKSGYMDLSPEEQGKIQTETEDADGKAEKITDPTKLKEAAENTSEELIKLGQYVIEKNTPANIKTEVHKFLAENDTAVNKIKNHIAPALELKKLEIEQKFQSKEITKEEFDQQNIELNKDLAEEAKTIMCIAKDIARAKDQLSKMMKEGAAKQNTGLTWRFVSIKSIGDTVAKFYKIFASEGEHEDAISTAVLEQAAGGILKHIPGIVGKRFEKGEKMAAIDKENLDAEERGEWKYENHDPSSLLQELYGLTDKDPQHLRALLEEMGKRGLIRWDDERLWKQFEVITGITMPEAAKTDERLRDSILEEMCIAAFGDKEWFRGQKDANMKGFISKYEERQTDSKKIENEGRTAEYMGKILQDHYAAAGKDLNEHGQMHVGKQRPHYFDNPDVDPYFFNAMLVSSIASQGITVEDKIFFLTRSIATGLVPQDFLTHIEDKAFFNEWPILNVFRKMNFQGICDLDKKFTQGKDITKLSSDDQKKYFFDGDHDTILKVLHNEFPANGGVQDRTFRVVENWPKVDKDVQQQALSLVPPSSIKALTRQFSGKPPISNSGVKNGLMGWTTRLASFDVTGADAGTSKGRTTAMRDSLASFIFFDGAVRGRTDIKEGKVRIFDADYDAAPGMRGDNVNLSVREFSAITKNFLYELLHTTTGKSYQQLDIYFKDNYPDKEAQDKAIAKLYETDFNQILARGDNEDKFIYLMEKWQSKKAFATYNNQGNARSSGVTKEGAISNLTSLQFNADEFQNWQNNGGAGKEYFKKSPIVNNANYNPNQIAETTEQTA